MVFFTIRLKVETKKTDPIDNNKEDRRKKLKKILNKMTKALKETQTPRARAVVRFGHRPPALPPARPPARYTTDRTDYNTLRRS